VRLDAAIAPTAYAVVGIDRQPIWRKIQPGNVGRSLLPLIDAANRPAGADGKPPSEQEKRRPGRGGAGEAEGGAVSAVTVTPDRGLSGNRARPA
jgi:hypothetical protein